MYKLKYYCDFYSVENTFYRIEILEDTNETITAEEVKLIADTATLEYNTIGYFDKMLFPSLSFTLLSERNFQFHSLYSSDIVRHKIVLYKEDQIIYTGFVDPEIYEEEYDSLTTYNVEISTSSLAILKRIDNPLFGMMTIKSIVSQLLGEIGITDINWNIQKKGIVDNLQVNVEDLTINTDVFLKENLNDFENCYDILESVLIPFGAWLYYYDNKVLITDKPQLIGNEINIDENILNDSSLEIADTYKDISIIFDPSLKTEKTSCELDYDTFSTKTPVSTVSYQMPEDTNFRSFTLQQFAERDFSTLKIPQNTSLESQGIYYRASRSVPTFSGSKESFVCHSWGQNGIGSNRINPAVCWWEDATKANKTIIETKLIPISDVQGDKWFINLQLNMLISACWNALEAPSIKNDEGNNSDFQNWSNFIYIGGDIHLCDKDGNVLYYYKNDNVIKERGWNLTYPEWIKVDSTSPLRRMQYFYSYYDNRKNTTPFNNSFANNSLSCGFTSKNSNVPFRFDKMKGNGDLIPLPPEAGYLRIRVLSGMEAFDSGMKRNSKLINKIKHMWYKSITVAITDENGISDKADNEYVYKGIIDNYAENSEEINTIIGIVPISEDSSKGSLYYSVNGTYKKVKGFKRSNNDTIGMLEEKTLTDYGDIFETKRCIIKGNTKPLNFLQKYKSQYFPNKTFVLSGRIHNLDMDEQESTFIEFPLN